MAIYKRMKIFYLITDLEPGGAENLLLEFCKYISKEEFDISVGYLKGKGGLKKIFKKAGIRVFDLNMRTRIDVFCLLRLAGFIKSEKFDIVHTHLIDADIFGFFAAKIAGIRRIVSTKHNTDDFRKKRTIPMLLDTFVGNKVSMNIAVSNSVREFLIKYQKIKPEKIEVVYNGINIEKFLPRKNKEKAKTGLGLNPKDHVIGLIGRFEKQKGHVYLVEAASKIISDIENVHLVFLGEGSLKKSIQGEVERLKLKSQVTFLNLREDVAAVLNAMDILVLPSLWEGLGMVLLEAMAAGVPVLASDVDGIREAVVNNQTGILVPPADSGKLAEQVLALLKDEYLRCTLSKNGRDFVEEKFNINKFVNKMESIYQQLKKN